MAQLLLTGFKMFCGLPAHEVLGPLIMTINPFNLLNIICYAGWLLGVRYSKPFATLGKGNWKTSAEWAVPFYAITMFLVYLLLFAVLCGAAAHAP